MRTLFFVLCLNISVLCSSYSQVTNNPYYNSNASVLTIEKITITNNSVIVNLELYTTDDNYSFWVNSGMYIQKYGDIYSDKYYIKEFVNNELDKTYTCNGYTTYHFTWVFEKIPKGLTNISIIEPESSNGTAWYWENISINNPASSSMSDFFKYKGVKMLAELVHPLNTYKSGEFKIYSDYVWVNIYYETYSTELKIDRIGDFFTNISVISDSNWLAPFAEIEFLQEIVLKETKDNSENKNLDEFERLIKKAVSKMDGKDYACLILTLAWLDY